MTIALIAHDSKKELMVQFCTAYCRILSQHKLVATGTTGKLISEATGLQVQRFLAGVQGGDQQIASRIACNEIDLLLFFRDPINAKPSEPNEMTLLRLCDVHNIPMATNIATAEVLLRGLDQLLHEQTGLPIHIAEDPLSAVAEGTGKALQELDFFTNVTDAED